MKMERGSVDIGDQWERKKEGKGEWQGNEIDQIKLSGYMNVLQWIPLSCTIIMHKWGLEKYMEDQKSRGRGRGWGREERNLGKY